MWNHSDTTSVMTSTTNNNMQSHPIPPPAAVKPTPNASSSSSSSSSSLRFAPDSGSWLSTSHPSHVSNFVANVTDSPSTSGPSTDSEEGLSGGVVAVVVILVAVGVAVVTFLVYLKVTGNMYRLLTCKVKVTKRRSSTSSSRRPLDVDDPEDEGRREDDLPVTREAAMFTIDDFEPVQNDEYSRGSHHEEYFYDEVFGQSMFEDEVTNASMRHLYLATNDEEDDMFEVDIISEGITTTTTTTTTATTPTTATANNPASTATTKTTSSSARKT